MNNKENMPLFNTFDDQPRKYKVRSYYLYKCR